MLRNILKFFTLTMLVFVLVAATIWLWWMWHVPNDNELSLIPFGVNIEKQTTGGILANQTQKAWAIHVYVYDKTYNQSKITRYIVSEQSLQTYEVAAPILKSDSVLISRIIFARKLSKHEFEQEILTQALNL